MNFMKYYKNLTKFSLKNGQFQRFYCECTAKAECHPKIKNARNLPLLPVPKLEYTLKKLLRFAEPFATNCELIVLENECKRFGKHEGKILQEILMERAKRTTNWLAEWYDDLYLCDRDSLPMSTSPAVLFPEEKFADRCEQLLYSGKLILAILKFHKMVLNHTVPLDSWKKYPMDISAFKRIFSSNRIPHTYMDKMMRYKGSKHIIVMINNNAFKLDVLSDMGQSLNYEQLMISLNKITDMAHITGEPFGLLTAHKRDKWALLRDHMLTLPNGYENLKILEEALFVFCIDDCSNKSMDSKLNGLYNAVHGHGPTKNGANRWHDKTLQFFVNPEGSSGLIFEHSSIDSIPVGIMTDVLINYVKGNEWKKLPKAELCCIPQILDFPRSPTLDCEMKESARNLEEKIRTFSCKISNFDSFGKDFCKKNKISADGVIQIALQHAYLKVHQKFMPQQDIATTRKYYQGRCDIVRSCTCEMIDFIKNMNNPLLFIREKIDILRNAARLHRQLLEDSMEGKGIDCHLFGLLMASKERNKEIPKLFADNAYRKCSKFEIASRPDRMKMNCFTCYPPRSGCGYGICYCTRSNDINICVACRTGNQCECYDVKVFLQEWATSMKSISDILCGYEKRKKRLCS